jgi:aldose 1-epimerase
MARLRFRSEAHPEIASQYPYPFELEAAYGLGTGGLVISVAVQNVGTSAMPMGVGLHPYLQAPVGPGRSGSAGRIRVPAAAHWELKDLLPTGRVLPASGPTDLRDGRSLEGLVLDTVLTQIEGGTEGEPIRCELEDRGEGIRTVLEAERVFREFVVYTVPGRSSVCIEPYTCVTDAPNLQSQGISAGLRVLAPGERFRARIRLRAEPV